MKAFQAPTKLFITDHSNCFVVLFGALLLLLLCFCLLAIVFDLCSFYLRCRRLSCKSPYIFGFFTRDALATIVGSSVSQLCLNVWRRLFRILSIVIRILLKFLLG